MNTPHPSNCSCGDCIGFRAGIPGAKRGHGSVEKPTLTSKESDDWLPCPFCGGADIRSTRHVGAGSGLHHRGEDVYTMCCYNCGATFPGRYRLELLREAWNRRPTIETRVVVPKEYETAHPALSELLDLTGLMHEGKANMDIGIMWMDALSRVEAMLSKATPQKAGES